MANLIGNLEIVEVKQDDVALELLFFNEEAGEVHTVRVKKQKYDEAKHAYVKDDETYKRYEETLADTLKVAPEDVDTLVGQSFDVWDAGNYCALWDSKTFSKFSEEDIGQILNADVVEIQVQDSKAVIVLDVDGEQYASNINWGNWVQSLNKSLPDPQRREKQQAKFETKFGIKWDNRDELIGKTVLIEVRKNGMNSSGNAPTFIEIKPFAKKK